MSDLSRQDALTAKVEAIERDIARLVREVSSEAFFVTHYGAMDINPRHLVYWVCIDSDAEKSALAGNTDLNANLRALLERHQYPEEARAHVHIGFESQETVDRDSDGNWWYHWK